MSEDFEEKKLDSPLIVHKVTDASFQETANEIDVDLTHNENDTAVTLERHRYRKIKKTKKWPYVLIALAASVVVIVCVLYFSGIIKPLEKETDTSQDSSNYAQSEENKYSGIITVKGSYVFFEGDEVDGINGLGKELEYADKNNSFIVQNDHADETFFSEEIIPLLESSGIKYEVKTVVSSGLTSVYESSKTDSAPAE